MQAKRRLQLQYKYLLHYTFIHASAFFKVREVIGEVSINHNYKPDTPLISMGFDSMKGLELLGQLEMRFKISVPDEALSDANTSLLDLVQVRVRVVIIL